MRISSDGCPVSPSWADAVEPTIGTSGPSPTPAWRCSRRSRSSLTPGQAAASLDEMLRRRLVAMAIVLATLHLAHVARAGAYLSSTWYEGADGWAQARRQQRAHGVPILVYFRAEWCPHCHALDEMLEEREVYSRLRRVIKVRIDPDDGEEEER